MSPRQLRLRAEANVQLVAGVNLLPLKADEDALPEVFPQDGSTCSEGQEDGPSSDVGKSAAWF